VIRVEGLSRSFGRIRAIDGVSFEARDGRITGLLGPNGAGKSTTLRVLYTVLRPDAGTATVDGIDVVRDPLAARRAIGVLPHSAGIYPQLTARENIAYFGVLHGLAAPVLERRVDELIAELDIVDCAERRAKGFSQGQRIKVALARALRSLILALRAAGHCVLFSSHVMQEVAALCDDIVIIDHGRVVAAGTPAQLLAHFRAPTLEDAFVAAVGDARGLE